ncbi:MAG: hypothetical protein AAF088_16840 [Pseudomonadota bacterium]
MTTEVEDITKDPEVEASPKIRTNTFHLEARDVTAHEFIPGSLNVTFGEPKDDTVKITAKNGVLTFTVKAGRKGSPDIARQFIEASGGAEHAASPFAERRNSQRNGPDLLNFYFKTNLTFTVGGQRIVAPLYFGQGHRDGHDGGNNWWMGGRKLISFLGRPSGEIVLTDVSLPDDSHHVQVYFINGIKHNEFRLLPRF